MSSFGKSPVFPTAVVFDPQSDTMSFSSDYGAWVGLNIQQHVWLTLFAVYQSSARVTTAQAYEWANSALPFALKRLEELA